MYFIHCAFSSNLLLLFLLQLPFIPHVAVSEYLSFYGPHIGTLENFTARSENWTLRKLEQKYLEENGGDKMINKIDKILQRIVEKRTLLNNIPRRNVNWTGNILRRNCLLRDAIEGQTTEVKGLGRRRTQLLDDLRKRLRYLELK